ncbi:MAG TPA: ABC transporter substrate-binding protein [Pelolinea sp.]|nr:ABC transporter substrate-binding protein [Pelolinea sp.]
MKRKNYISILLIITAVLLSACEPGSAIKTQVSVIDGLGKEITLEAPAKSIVTLSPPITEMLFAIGAGGQIVARDSFSDFPAEALDLQDIGGGFSDYDLETILTLDPDVVIAGGINTPELVQSLEDLGLTVYYLANPASLEEMFGALHALGGISGHETEANNLANDLEARVKAVDDALSKDRNLISVFYELDATDPAKPYTPGPGSFYSHLIYRAGGDNIGDELGAEWAQAGLEFLLVRDPQFILLGDAMWGTTPESVAERPGWSALTAVKEGRVLPFDDNLLARIGPRQVDGLEVLARIFHPEAFE